MPNRKARGVTVITVTIFFLFAWTTLSAAESNFVELPMPEEFSPALQQDGSPLYATAASIENTFRKYNPKLKKFYHNKDIKQFIVPGREWLKSILVTYDSFISSTGIRAKQDTWDCENYSSMLNNLITVRLWRAGYLDTRAAVGWVRVIANKIWAGYQSPVHAVMFTVTDKGIFIIEPQNGQYINLSAYPNRETIEEVYLF
jgi:hypothetical protein